MKKNSIKFTLIILFVAYILLNGIKFNDGTIQVKEEEDTIKRFVDDFTYYGTGFVTMKADIFNDLTIVGDSYTNALDNDIGGDLITFSRSGFKVSLLHDNFLGAIKANKKYVVIFIGPNDFIAQTDLDEFKNVLNQYISEVLAKTNSTIVLSSYLESIITVGCEEHNPKTFPNRIKQYDSKLREIVKEDETERVLYFDIFNINDYEKYKRAEDDLLHFNAEFNCRYLVELHNFLKQYEDDLNTKK